MHFQFELTPEVAPAPAGHAAGTMNEVVDLLRQILDVQRQQLTHLQATAAAHDSGQRWRAFLARWQTDFPTLSKDCRNALPILERSYGGLIAELTDHLCQTGTDALDTDFALQEFLDRYGMRLAQLGTILNLVAPLADAGPQGESA